MMKKIVKKLLPANLRVKLRYSWMEMQAKSLKGDTVFCNCCEGSFSEFQDMTQGRTPRYGVKCPRCHSAERHRLLMLYLKEKTEVFKSPHKILHFAPEYGIQKQLQEASGEHYMSADLNSPLAMKHFDIMEIPYSNRHFDLILCSHVLAFVEDDAKALVELYRVLKPGGVLLIQTDIHDTKETVTHPEMQGKIKEMTNYNQWERLRSYGNQFFMDIQVAGFDVEEDHFAAELPKEIQDKYCINPSETILVCTKNVRIA